MVYVPEKGNEKADFSGDFLKIMFPYISFCIRA